MLFRSRCRTSRYRCSGTLGWTPTRLLLTAVGELESTKSVSDLFAPVTGEIVSVNDTLESSPETVNADPYGQGWLITVRVADPAALDGLMDAAAYGAATES